MRATRSILFVLAIVLAGGFVPASEATPPSVRIAFAADEVHLAGLPSNVHAERIGADRLTPGDLRHYDALVLDAETLEAAWSHPGTRNALRSFVNSHRVVVLEGADPFARFDLPGLPQGGDVPADENGPLPVAASARVLYRAARGDWDLAGLDYGAADGFRASLAGDAAAWVNGLRDFEPRAGEPLTAQAADNANWAYRVTVSYTYTWNPYGKIGYSAQFYYASTDGTSAYKWWNVEMDQTMEPGRSLYGNNWRTHMTWLTSDVKYYYATNQLVDWFPWGDVDSSTGYTTMSGEMGMTSGVDGAVMTSKMSTGYSIDYMYLNQGSGAGSDQIYVRHDYEYNTPPASTSWTNTPSVTVRVDEPNCIKIPWTNKAQWREYTGTGTDNYYTNWINSWREIC